MANPEEKDLFGLEPEKTYYMLIETVDNVVGGFQRKDIFTVNFIGIIDSERMHPRVDICLFSNVKPYKSFRQVIQPGLTLGPREEIENDNTRIANMQIRSEESSYEAFQLQNIPRDTIPYNPNSYRLDDYIFYGKRYDPSIRSGQLVIMTVLEPYRDARFFEKKSKTDIDFNDIFRIKDNLERGVGNQKPVGPDIARKIMSFLDPKKLGGKRKSKKTRKCR